MKTYTIYSKDSGSELYSVEAENAEAAIRAMEADIGPIPCHVTDDTKGVNGVGTAEIHEFESASDALQVFVPEALFEIESAE